MKKSNFNLVKIFSSLFSIGIIICFSFLSSSYSADIVIKNDTALKLKADKAILNKENGIFSFSGKVEILYKEYQIKSDFLKATQNKKLGKKISLIEAKGNVFLSNSEDINATGDALIFDVKDQFILIKGNVEFVQGKSVIKGKSVYIDLLTENIEIDGSINSYILN